MCMFWKFVSQNHSCHCFNILNHYTTSAVLLFVMNLKMKKCIVSNTPLNSQVFAQLWNQGILRIFLPGGPSLDRHFPHILVSVPLLPGTPGPSLGPVTAVSWSQLYLKMLCVMVLQTITLRWWAWVASPLKLSVDTNALIDQKTSLSFLPFQAKYMVGKFI